MSDKTLQLAKMPGAFTFNSSNEPTQIRAGFDNITVANRFPNNNNDGIDGNLWYYTTNSWLFVKVNGQWEQILVEHNMIQYDFIVGVPSSFPAGVTWQQDLQQIVLTNSNLHVDIGIITLNGTVLSEGENYVIHSDAIRFIDLGIEDSDKITVTGQVEEVDTDGRDGGGGGGGGGGITPGNSAIQILFPRGSDAVSITGGSATVSGNTITSSIISSNSTVQVNGINFINTLDYTVSGTTITFTGFNVRAGTGDLIIITGG